MTAHKKLTKKKRRLTRHRRRNADPKTPLTQVDRHKYHFVYILWSDTLKLVYVGYCVKPSRRLRQHRGEITQGAKFTTKWHPAKDWRMIAIIGPFLNIRDGQFFEYSLARSGQTRMRRPSKSIRNVCAAVMTTLHVESLAPKKGWTKQALPLDSPLRDEIKVGSARFHAVWFPPLPAPLSKKFKSSITTCSSELAQHAMPDGTEVPKRVKDVVKLFRDA